MSGSAPETTRPTRRTKAVWIVAGLALLGLSLWWSSRTWVGHNGDHAYYTAMALQYSGMSFGPSLDAVADYFHYPEWSVRLGYGFLNPTVAPLVYPRVMYPLLAVVPVKLFGIGGIYLPGIAAGIATTLVLAISSARRSGAILGLLPIVILLGSREFTEFGFGIYVDALVLLGIALMLCHLPWRGETTRWHVITVCALAVLMLLSRQVPLIPVGMLAGGWLWETIRTRRLRNPWLVHLVATTAVVAATWLALGRWAPYDPLLFLEYVGVDTDPGDLLTEAPVQVWDGLQGAAALVWHRDPATLILTVLALIGLWRVRTTPLAGVTIGLLGACLATLALNNLGHIRYLAPLFPVLALLAADGLRAMAGPFLAARGLGTDEQTTAHRRPRSARAPAAALTGLIVLVMAATIVVNRPASFDGARTATIEHSEYPDWPLRVDRGRVTCAGDNKQVWFETPDGTRYALTGTAMASSFWAPRILELADGPIAYGWPELTPLVSAGTRLCDKPRGHRG